MRMEICPCERAGVACAFSPSAFFASTSNCLPASITVVSPLSRATAPVVEWQGRAVIPNGETRPGVRSPEVWALDLK